MEHRAEELENSYVEAASEGLWRQEKVLSLYKINFEDKVSFGRYTLSVNGSQSSVLIYIYFIRNKNCDIICGVILQRNDSGRQFYSFIFSFNILEYFRI